MHAPDFFAFFVKPLETLGLTYMVTGSVEATIYGNILKGYINGVEVISATDDTFETGSPGIGFNFGVGDTNVDHGFTFFEVHTYDD